MNEFYPNIRIIQTNSKKIVHYDQFLSPKQSLAEIEAEQDPDLMAGKISVLLGQYELEYQKHESKFETLKNNAKSMIFKNKNQRQINFQKTSQQLEKFGRIAASRNIERKIDMPF